MNDKEISQYELSVKVKTTYIGTLASNTNENIYCFNYTLYIENLGSQSTRLLSDYWFLSSSDDDVVKMEGKTIANIQPLIRPGEVFEHNNHITTKSPIGFIEGSYSMIAENGESFEMMVSPFTLAAPGHLH